MHLVYKLRPLDYDRYREHLKKLDDESKYLRFGHAIKNEVIDILCDKIRQNASKHKIFVIEDDELNVIAAGHISLEDDPVELAFSVLKDYQGQGLGSALMKRCVEWCQNRGIETGCMVCLQQNTAIKKLAAKHGVLVQSNGEALAELKIPNPNALSFFNEFAEDKMSFMDHVGKAQKKFARMFRYPLQF
jgi:GNAT superfamily N-acetyltransferase